MQDRSNRALTATDGWCASQAGVYVRDLGAGAFLIHLPSFIEPGEATELMAGLTTLPFLHPSMMGRATLRGTTWHALQGWDYRYSGITLTAQPFTPELEIVRRRLDAAALHLQGAHGGLDCVLVNDYPDGRAGLGWHADDEPCFEPNWEVASVSFGETRRFDLTPGDNLAAGGRRLHDPSAVIQLELGHGALLIMGGTTQHLWRHRVPKTQRRGVARRINLTWRRYAAR